MTSLYLCSWLAFAATLLGASILLWRQDWAKKHIWRILAFASGILLGVSFMSVVPEAMEYAPRAAGIGVMVGFFLLFVIEGFTMMHSCAEFAEDCHVHIVGWGAFGALAMHALLDGLALSIAFRKGESLGTSVAAAILVHKMTDGLTLTGLLLGSHFSRKKCFTIVSLLALATPLGALLFYPVSSVLGVNILGGWLGFVAGTFFYVGAADILPRIHRTRDLYCLFAFAAGLLIGSVRLHG